MLGVNVKEIDQKITHESNDDDVESVLDRDEKNGKAESHEPMTKKINSVFERLSNYRSPGALFLKEIKEKKEIL